MAENKKASPKVRMTIVAYATVAQLAGVNKGNHMASSPDVAVSDKKRLDWTAKNALAMPVRSDSANIPATSSKAEAMVTAVVSARLRAWDT